ncbi:hypothetical protein [Bradyrhizobium sp. DASA03007]|uniref:hypothetical protein n=1 Tax=unclassified Bradyrhizobium TaxID=2631580 RepID=UPI003F6E5E4E
MYRASRICDATKARWLRAIATNGALIGVATTELGVGAVARYQTAVTSDGGGLQLNGTKHCATGTLYADHVIVAADQSGKRIAAREDIRDSDIVYVANSSLRAVFRAYVVS